ncbi:MAG: hypothetical protein ACRDRL_05535 [Sciscionella sp.]
MSEDPMDIPTLAVLSASRVRQEAVARRPRLLAPLVLVTVIWVAFNAAPHPGASSRGLAVSVALGGLMASALGSWPHVGAPARSTLPWSWSCSLPRSR